MLKSYLLLFYRNKFYSNPLLSYKTFEFKFKKKLSCNEIPTSLYNIYSVLDVVSAYIINKLVASLV